MNKAEDHKQKLAKHIFNLISDKNKIILGSGSTVNVVIDYLYNNHKNLTELQIYSASSFTSLLLSQYGISELNINNLDLVNNLICIDSVDQVVFENKPEYPSILKGHGNALLREKVLWTLADKIFVLLGEEKVVSEISEFLPVEIIPFGFKIVQKKIDELKLGKSILRTFGTSNTPLITDNNNYIIDIYPDNSFRNLSRIQNDLKLITGVIDTGLFLSEFTSKCIFYISGENEIKEIK